MQKEKIKENEKTTKKEENGDRLNDEDHLVICIESKVPVKAENFQITTKDTDNNFNKKSETNTKKQKVFNVQKVKNPEFLSKKTKSSVIVEVKDIHSSSNFNANSSSPKNEKNKKGKNSSGVTKTLSEFNNEEMRINENINENKIYCSRMKLFKRNNYNHYFNYEICSNYETPKKYYNRILK